MWIVWTVSSAGTTRHSSATRAHDRQAVLTLVHSLHATLQRTWRRTLRCCGVCARRRRASVLQTPGTSTVSRSHPGDGSARATNRAVLARTPPARQ
eukprot:4869995-Prymnesium_polylepis.1